MRSIVIPIVLIAAAWALLVGAMGTVPLPSTSIDPRLQDLLQLLQRLEGSHPLDPLWPGNREELPHSPWQKIDQLVRDIESSKRTTNRQ